MSHDRDRKGERGSTTSPEAFHARPAPGKNASTSSLRPPVQAHGGAIAQPRTGEGTGSRPHFELIQRAFAGAGASVQPDSDASVARARGGTGAPLPDATRAGFGHSLGSDLGDVRVHTGSEAASAAASVGARAFTMGNDIYFGRDQYDPSSASGQLLLAHEVVHTVQQAGGARTGERQNQLEVSEPGDSLEQEAERLAPDVVAGRPAPVTGGGGGVARAIMRWAASPPDAVQARIYVQSSIASARDAEDIAAIIAALEEPNSSDGLLEIRMPHDAPISIVDLDLSPLLAEARARQRALGGLVGGGRGTTPTPRADDDRAIESTAPPVAAEAPAHDAEAGAATVRTAITRAASVEAIDAIRDALSLSTYDRTDDPAPVMLEVDAMSQTVWVARSQVRVLQAEVARRRTSLVAQDEAEARDRAMGRAYDDERADEREHAERNREEIEDQERAEAADREARGLGLVRAAIEAHADSLTREHIRDALRATTDDGHGMFRAELPDGRRPELNAADRAEAITLAERAVTEARAAERAAGSCRAPEGDTSELTPEQRTDLIRQIGDTLVECGNAFDSAAQTLADQLRSAASHERDMAKLIFKVAFQVISPLFGSLPDAIKSVVGGVGALGEAAAGTQASALAGAGDATAFLTVLQDAQRQGRQAISADLNCHTSEELQAIRSNYQAIIAAGQDFYGSRLRTLNYNFDNQVAEVGRTRERGLDTADYGGLAWITHGAEAHLAVVHHRVDRLAPFGGSYHFHSWVFREMASMAMARDEHIEELSADDLEHWFEASPPPAPSYAYRRGDPLPEGAPPVRA